MAPRPKPVALVAARALAALVITCALAVAVRAEVDRNIYRSTTVGVEIVFPPDWAVSEQRSYPYLLATAIDRVLGGRMTLSQERLREGEKLRDAVERNRTTLKKLGFKLQAQGITTHPTGALVFEATTPDGRSVVRQAYRTFEDSDAIFVVTLAAPVASMQRYRRAFDDSLRGMSRTRVIAPRTPAPATRTPTPPAIGIDDDDAPEDDADDAPVPAPTPSGDPRE